MNRDGMQSSNQSAADLLYLVDQLEELVGGSKRVPLSNRVMVEEADFLSMIDQLRVALPTEIKQAQRVIKERERVIGEAQDEAMRIVQAARERAELLVSQNVIIAEARQRAEVILRDADEEQQRTRGELDVFILEQLDVISDAAKHGMAEIEGAVEKTLMILDDARNRVGQD